MFPTRLVLQTEDEAQSVRLIGRPDAAMLEEGGDLLFTLDGRAPRRLRGFRVSHQGLGALLRLLTTSFGVGGAAVPLAVPLPPLPCLRPLLPRHPPARSSPFRRVSRRPRGRAP